MNLEGSRNDRNSNMVTWDEAARRLQRVFRGWRVRQYVVKAVRQEMEVFMSEMETEMEMERLLVGLAKPQTHHWEASHGCLQLPRIHDNVFGWECAFPGAMPSSREVQVVVHHGETTEKELATGKDQLSNEEFSVDEDKRFADTKEPCTNTEEHSVRETDDNVDVRSHEGGDATDVADEIEVATVVAPAERSPGAVRDEESQPLASSVDKSNDQYLTVDQILMRYTKDEIILELEWARQALQDRLRYLKTSTLDARKS